MTVFNYIGCVVENEFRQ